MDIEFTNNWLHCVKPNIILYATKRCRILGYCSSAIDAKNNVHGKVKMILRDVGITDDTVSLIGGDGIIMRA